MKTLKKFFFLLMVLTVAVAPFTFTYGGAQDEPGKEPQPTQPAKPGLDMTSPDIRTSYTIGYDMGLRFKEHMVGIDLDILFMGLKDSLTGEASLVDPEYFEKYMTNFFKAIETRKKASRDVWGEKNKKEGEAFLNENKTKEGIITCKSGLQYKILRPGTGAKPGPDDTVTIQYRGTLVDGTEFHDSYSKGGPVSFAIAKTFTGWQEALRMMKKGAKWRVFLPPDLAWAEEGLGDVVGPYAVIIFDIELLDFKPTVEEKKGFKPQKLEKEK